MCTVLHSLCIACHISAAQPSSVVCCPCEVGREHPGHQAQPMTNAPTTSLIKKHNKNKNPNHNDQSNSQHCDDCKQSCTACHGICQCCSACVAMANVSLQPAHRNQTTSYHTDQACRGIQRRPFESSKSPWCNKAGLS